MISGQRGNSQVRVKSEKGTVVIWDNRVTVYCALHTLMMGSEEKETCFEDYSRGENPVPVKY
jgi:alpha-ketoglutarate-dependent taurine dioxygenase